MKISTILRRTKEWLETHKWIKGEEWKDADGRSMGGVFENPKLKKEVAAACLWGAIVVNCPSKEALKANSFLRASLGQDVMCFNDTAKSKQTVLKALDAAIQEAKEQKV